MIKNRPKLSAIPLPNNRLLVQGAGTTLFATLVFGSFALALAINATRDMHSLKLYPTRKRFTFKSDPYSGTVNCTYQDVSYKQSGY